MSHGRLDADARKVQSVQLAFLRMFAAAYLSLYLYLPSHRGGSGRMLSSWWVQLVDFAVRVSELPPESLDCDILRVGVLYAFAKPPVGNRGHQGIILYCFL